MKLSSFRYVLPFFFMLSGCSSTPQLTAQKLFLKDGSEVPVAEVGTYQKALRFDRLCTGELSKEEITTLKSECGIKGEEDPFCSSILTLETWQKQIRINRNTNSAKNRNGRNRNIIFAKIKTNKIVNWFDLRFGAVSALIKGLHSLPANQLKLVQQQALAETNCPNNIAIALAAHLENKLPDRIEYTELAKLYEVGGACPSDKDSLDEISSVRSGLFHLAANEPKLALDQLSKTRAQTDAFRARPLYWIYRIHQQLGNSDAAELALNELKRDYPFSFHTLVALTSSGRDPGEILNRKSVQFLTRSEKKEALNPILNQVEILQKYQFQTTASKLIDWLLHSSTDAEPEVQLYLANLKDSQGDHFGKFSILSNVLYNNPELISRNTLEQYFPKMFFPIFEKNSHGLDPLLLLAVARRESAFNTRAISSANARGLLQITPNTLRELNYDKDLFDPESNVFVGSKYLSDLLERSNAQIHLALAAYNAGPHRVNVWLQRYPTNDPVLFMDLIPFRETRNYVAAVLRNYYWYRRLHHPSNKPEGPVQPFQWSKSNLD